MIVTPAITSHGVTMLDGQFVFIYEKTSRMVAIEPNARWANFWICAPESGYVLQNRYIRILKPLEYVTIFQ